MSDLSITKTRTEACLPPSAPLTSEIPNEEIADITDFPFNDLGNAQRLELVHGVDLRFVPAWGRWLVWDDSKWAVDTTGEVYRRMMNLSRVLQRQAADLGDSARESCTSWSLKMGSARAIENALAVASKFERIATTHDQLDGDPYLLGVQNGTVDLTDGTFRPSKRDDLITKCAGASYDRKAECPRWDEFLFTITAGDKRLIRFLQQAVGYSLTGMTSEHCLIFCYGLGRNGKTTLVETVATLAHDYAQGAPESLFIKSSRGGDQATNDMAALCGSRFAYGVELEEGAAMAESKIKRLTGGDSITARFMHKEFFTFRPTHTLWVSGNHKPRVKGTDVGIWRRLRLVPFKVQIPDSDVDPTLPDQLRGELSGIANWAIAGCLDWQESGLVVPSVVSAATDDYRSEEDVLGHFLADHTDVAPDARVSKSTLYERYTLWCQNEGIKFALSKNRLTSKLKERGIEDYRSNSVPMWRGIALSEDR